MVRRIVSQPKPDAGFLLWLDEVEMIIFEDSAVLVAACAIGGRENVIESPRFFFLDRFNGDLLYFR